jgi:hypothetical protein
MPAARVACKAVHPVFIDHAEGSKKTMTFTFASPQKFIFPWTKDLVGLVADSAARRAGPDGTGLVHPPQWGNCKGHGKRELLGSHPGDEASATLM